MSVAIVLFKEKFNDYEDLLKKKKELKKKFPHLIHSVSVKDNVIKTMTVNSYVKDCINQQTGLKNKITDYEMRNYYGR